jgi:hypothetical protein
MRSISGSCGAVPASRFLSERRYDSGIEQRGEPWRPSSNWSVPCRFRCRWPPSPAMRLAATPLPSPRPHRRGNGNDNGLYLVRQINNEIWWRGIGNEGSFSNVHSATRSGNSISGIWADVTVGSIRSQGQLILQIVMLPGSPIPLLQRTSESGGFGGSIWLPLRNI